MLYFCRPDTLKGCYVCCIANVSRSNNGVHQEVANHGHLLSHCTCFENINHVEYPLLCLGFDLLTQEKRCIYSTLSVNLPPTYIVLKLKGDGVIRRCKRVCVESVPFQGILWYIHFIQLCPLLPYLLDLGLQHIATVLCML